MAIDSVKWQHEKKNLAKPVKKLLQAIERTLAKLGPEITDYDSADKEKLQDLRRALKELNDDVDRAFQANETVAVREGLAALEKAGELFGKHAGDGTLGDLVAENIPGEYSGKAVLNSYLKSFDEKLGTSLAPPDALREEEPALLEQLKSDAKDAWSYMKLRPDGTALDGIDALKKSFGSGKYDNIPIVKNIYLTAILAARMAADSVRGSKSSLKKPLTQEAFENTYVRLGQDRTLQEFLAHNGEQAIEALKKGHGGAIEDMLRESGARLDKLPDDVEPRFAPTVGQRIGFLENKLKGVDKEEDRMKDPKRNEIRRVLLGKALLGEDGRLYPVPAGTIMRTPIGVGDGAASIRMFGVKRRIRRYETKDGKARVTEAAKKSMQNIGRGLALAEQPAALACLIRYVLTRPVVLTFSYEDGTPTLTAWTGRGVMGWISLRRAIRAFEKGLPETMKASEGNAAQEDKVRRKAEKERKKAEKAQKKAEKKAKKADGGKQEDTAQTPEDAAQTPEDTAQTPEDTAQTPDGEERAAE